MTTTQSPANLATNLPLNSSIPERPRHMRSLSRLMEIVDSSLSASDRPSVDSAETLQQRLLQPLLNHSQALAAYVLCRQNHGWAITHRIVAVPQAGKSLAEPLLHAAATAAVEQHQAVRNLVHLGSDQRILCLAPIAENSGGTTVVGMEWDPRDIDSESPLLLTQFFALALQLARQSSRHREATRATSESTAILELVSQLQTAKNMDEAATLLVDQLREFLGAKQVLLGWSPAAGKPVRLHSISNMRDIDRHSPRSQSCEAALVELAMHPEDLITLDRGCTTIAASRALALLLEQSGADALSGYKLNVSDQTAGTLLVLEDTSSNRTGDTQRFLSAAAPLIAGCLSQLGKAEPRPLAKYLQRMLPRTRFGRRTAIATAVTMCLVMLIPWPYRIAAPLRLEPVERRFVAAPFAAILERAYVEPGDQVNENELLAVLDARELQWELSGLEAEYDRAEKQRDVAIARRESAAAQQAQLELQRLASKRELLAYRMEHLEIRSPLAGVIVTGDLSKAQHAPLEAGQKLFEVAPLHRMSAEIAVPESEVPRVQPGQVVELRIDSSLKTSWRGQIATIRPRAELRDGQQVFVAEVILENLGDPLRPGMSGRARITSDSQPIGWILFHRPLEALVRLWGW